MSFTTETAKTLAAALGRAPFVTPNGTLPGSQLERVLTSLVADIEAAGGWSAWRAAWRAEEAARVAEIRALRCRLRRPGRASLPDAEAPGLQSRAQMLSWGAREALLRLHLARRLPR